MAKSQFMEKDKLKIWKVDKFLARRLQCLRRGHTLFSWCVQRRVLWIERGHTLLIHIALAKVAIFVERELWSTTRKNHLFCPYF